MTGKDDDPEGVPELRRRAEEIARSKPVLRPAVEVHSAEEALKLIHELRVHQIELEMQNDALRQAQAELKATRARYFDLYNLAPVGYFIVSHDGRIMETNLTGANLLGFARAALVTQPITRFIFREDQDAYYLHRREVLATGKARACDLRMVRVDGTPFWVRMTATTTGESSASSGPADGGAPVLRVVLSDISEQKQMEQEGAERDTQVRPAKNPDVGPKTQPRKRRKGVVPKTKPSP